MKIKMLVSTIVCLLFIATGCVPISDLYIGKPVTSAPVIKFQDHENAAGTWQTFDVTINYNYSRSDELIEITGQGELSQHYQMVYDGVRTMRVYLFLLDADGIVIKTVDIPTFLTTTEDIFTFNVPIKGSENIKAFSFGYSGVVSDREGQSYFDSLP